MLAPETTLYMQLHTSLSKGVKYFTHFPHFSHFFPHSLHFLFIYTHERCTHDFQDEKIFASVISRFANIISEKSLLRRYHRTNATHPNANHVPRRHHNCHDDDDGTISSQSVTRLLGLLEVFIAH